MFYVGSWFGLLFGLGLLCVGCFGLGGCVFVFDVGWFCLLVLFVVVSYVLWVITRVLGDLWFVVCLFVDVC